MDGVIERLDPFLDIIEIPLSLAGIGLQGWYRLVWLVIVAIAGFLILRSVWRYFFRGGRRMMQSGALADSADIDAVMASKGADTDFNAQQQALGTLKVNSDHLKKTKQWDQLAELYAAANSPSDAAQYYVKAKMYKEAGVQLAQTGASAKAAKLMVKGGDYETAGLFMMQHAKHAQAAKYFVKGGHTALAADAYAKAKNPKKAIAQFREYFQSPRDSDEVQLKTAESCFELLHDEKLMKKVDEDEQRALYASVAQIFQHDKRYNDAAVLFRDSGDMGRAGEVFVLAGDFESAAACMKAAGREQEASLLGGRFYEQQERWKEAAMAYAGAGEYEKCGQCFLKANEPVRAGEFFEKAKLYAQSGYAFTQGKRYDKAIEVLQRVPDSDPKFDASRGVLGRCFYEMNDYEHCAATLDNHLLNQRIDQQNMDYFYMLALACEQLGDLKKSKELLLKISSVSSKYRDLKTRISSIDSRISMVESQSAMHSGIQNSGIGGGAPNTLNMVANTLGDRYDLQTELGRGGMGVVYRARDKQLDRTVALKFLGNLVDNSEEFRQRFIREAQTAAKITHPNIVAIYDISASDGKAYIAMEYLEGKNLYKFIEQQGPLPPRIAVPIMMQVCDALHAIHNAGIVHRDIKPDNICLMQTGQSKLMDFGLAKAETNRITQEGMIMGTPSYMAPELAMGKDVDGRTDIYAMGLVLYEMLTGKIVFGDGDAMMRQVKEMPAPLSELVPGLPEGLSDIAYKCIQKNPNDRFQTAGEIVQALRSVKLS